jgi:aspartyl-tRNA(Asn)/glutamyl-tRNA(Gln) amidotransferase subunit A
MEIVNLTGWEIKEKFLNKEISAIDIVEEHFNRIDEAEDGLNSFITLDYENAIDAANNLDKKLKNGEELGALAGLPIGIKDNIITKNLRTTCGSEMLKRFIPPYDSHVVDRIKKSDGIILGKTNLDEFAMGSTTETSFFGPTKNPTNLDLTAGGSSGGSAAAVAVNEVVLALGTDTGGSIRQPAAFSNVIGIKPSYGLISRYGVVPMANTLDAVGVFAKDVRDATLMLNAISGFDEKDLTSVKSKSIILDSEPSLKGLKVALIKEFEEINIDPTIKEEFQKARQKFQDEGAIVEEISLPSIQFAMELYHIISSAELASNMARFDGIRYGFRAEEYTTLDELYIKSRTEGFGEEVKKRIIMGTYFLSGDKREEYYMKALKVRTILIQEFKNLFKNFDLVISPTTTSLPYELGKIRSNEDVLTSSIFTTPANLAGLCAISLPCSNNIQLPVGLQIIGDRFKDSKVINAALGFERLVK